MIAAQNMDDSRSCGWCSLWNGKWWHKLNKLIKFIKCSNNINHLFWRRFCDLKNSLEKHIWAIDWFFLFFYCQRFPSIGTHFIQIDISFEVSISCKQNNIYIYENNDFLEKFATKFCTKKKKGKLLLVSCLFFIFF